MPYLPRGLARTVGRALETFPAVLLTGSRQSGKTTLLREEFGQRFAHVSLDRPDVRLRARSDPVGFLSEHPAPLILDEIQYVPELLAYIKERVDEHRAPGQWLLSGSQSFPLIRGERSPLHFWRSSAGLEVDIVFERDNLIYAVEIKATSTPLPRHVDALSRWRDLAGPMARAAFACQIERPHSLAPGIRAVPWLLDG